VFRPSLTDGYSKLRVFYVTGNATLMPINMKDLILKELALHTYILSVVELDGMIKLSLYMP
jgi:hypothetical protein